MLKILIALLMGAPAGARPKFEDYGVQALMAATVLRVSCGANTGHVMVERDEYNFWDHAGVVDIPVTAAECERLVRRTSAALRCYGHARIDLFVERPQSDAVVIVDFGFARNEGICSTGSGA